MNNEWFARDKIKKKKRITYLTQIHIVENSDFHCCHINCDNKDDFKLTKWKLYLNYWYQKVKVKWYERREYLKDDNANSKFLVYGLLLKKVVWSW